MGSHYETKGQSNPKRPLSHFSGPKFNYLGNLSPDQAPISEAFSTQPYKRKIANWNREYPIRGSSNVCFEYMENPLIFQFG